MFVLICSGSAMPVLANNLPDVEVSIYLDGYPVDGTVIGDSSVNVYEAGSFDAAIDTVEPGTAVTIVNLQVWANGTNYFSVSYIKDDIEYSGLVEFDFVQPVGAVITQAPMVDIEEFDKNQYETFKDFIEGVKIFFNGIGGILHNIFPFFTNKEIALVVSFIVVFLGVLVYLFFRKVTI